ncbi:hypothetical protein MPNT_10117 [Candidatus Methylacidithermus pantelleriae]|uniref:Uncharacterized protein n=1 Tax=Candidatus Methylacidithermus pantelleriae TaxID=2744239 RepID=A0A8J2BK25_9BACT|nr:hypothetical protein MPNT_10117 [Candidatus Methylacidithermus pantelleriae]
MREGVTGACQASEARARFPVETLPYWSGGHRDQPRIISPWVERGRLGNLARIRGIRSNLDGKSGKQAKATFAHACEKDRAGLCSIGQAACDRTVESSQEEA